MIATTAVQSLNGDAEGVLEAGVRSFYSLPYAAPLTDERRFRPPAPVEPWLGVRNATAPGPSAPQSVRQASDIDTWPLLGFVTGGNDYLTLNVFAPAAARDAPVMVFIHGGSFIAGSKDASVYSGKAFARDGVVCVVINYRLGIEGFLPLVGGETNLGLRDIIAALQWVKGSISCFGGDPRNVTLFGESGGAYCISALMTSPLAKGLFQRAICQSGHVHLSRDLSIMQKAATHAAQSIGIEATREAFVSIGIEAMLQLQNRMMAPGGRIDMRDESGRDPSYGLTSFLPLHGDDVLPRPSIDLFREGAGGEIDLLIGSTVEEANIFFVPGGLRDVLDRNMALAFLSVGLPDAERALAAYGLDQPGEKPGYVLSRALTDLMFRAMTRRMAEWHGRAWVYEFDWRSPAIGGQFGAAHAIELPFVFDTLDAVRGERSILGEASPADLARRVHGLWIEFARTGRAPWPKFSTDTRQVFSLTTGRAAREEVLPAAQFLP